MPFSPSVPSLAPAMQHPSSQPGERPGRATCADPWGPCALQTLCQVSTGVGFWEAQPWCRGVAADPRGSSKARTLGGCCPCLHPTEPLLRHAQDCPGVGRGEPCVSPASLAPAPSRLGLLVGF